MPDYSGECWKTYLHDRDANKLVHCVYNGVIGHSGKEGLNAKAIEVFVNLAREQGQQTYIELDKVKQTRGPTGGLYPWLIKYGADILEQKTSCRAYRIRKEFYREMLSLFPEDEPVAATHGILKLQGLGKEIWAGIDAQEYINRERAAWGG